MSESTKQREQDQQNHGVLLYYKYTSPIENLDELFNFYESNCSSLGLLGRVRLSPQGVNVTVGGRLSSLERHIEAVKEYSSFEGTDFKLAACKKPLNDKVAEECGFTSLSIRIVKELVTLSSNALSITPLVSNAGRHLSATEFHSILRGAGKLLEKESGTDGKKLVLLDARNLYETRIGKFEAPNVQTLDPSIRQYSDLPTWINENVEQLRGNCVLMYCTGGIRCEMASAYIRSKGIGFGNVFQLYGGIQRYMEQYPAGGFFKGKNFVFDHRISVGSSNKNIISKCLLCGASFDDYSSRCRCDFCRMLVLVCNECQKESAQYVCELCQRRVKGLESLPSVDIDNSEANVICDVQFSSAVVNAACHCDHSATNNQLSCGGPGHLRKLRILCLHGFRQNASSFKGRTASLAKKLKSIAELVFIDAPHELPFIYQPTANCQHDNSIPSLLENPPSSKNCNKRYAWLVASDSNGQKATDWEMTNTPFDPLQYQHQTEGFSKSLSSLNTVFSQRGPFDGILGFSQVLL
ncbi:hypothetical protein Nepgr_012258 [Nepenthes gracilis]|uniref:Rhodanese domain-containing protein n=1 Tax=Nepenthes gracilis TaxID=150966 RepID=A0AAD3SFT5_NEPGR|nr:hypothetical protein Nepgr_012258 [Nepenthes gracilis]